LPLNCHSFDAEKGISQVNKAMCQGLRTCVAACPAGAISAPVFSNEQIFAQIEGLLALDYYGEI